METPAGWYPDPSTAPQTVGMMRYWDGAEWTARVAPGAAYAPVLEREHQRIEPWALFIALLPLVGILGGAIALIKGNRLNGSLMILIGLSSAVLLQVLRGS